VPDDGSRAVELESALAALQQAGDETNDASARAALTAAHRGEARNAERWFLLAAKRREHGSAEARREAADAYRRLAALASVHDRAKAREALRRAVRLAPDDPALWARLGAAEPQRAEAEHAYRRAIELSGALDEQDITALKANKRTLAIALSHLAEWSLEPAKRLEVETLHGRALQLYEDLGDREDLARQLTRLGWFCRSNSIERQLQPVLLTQSAPELDQAANYFTRALELYSELGDELGVVSLLGCQAMLARDRGDFEEAEMLSQRALALSEGCGCRATIIACLNGLMGLYVVQKRSDEARAIQDRLQRERQLLPDGLFAMGRSVARGGELLTLGDIDGASECFQRAKDAYDEIGLSEGLGRSLAGLGMVAAQRGASEEAQAYWAQAREHFDDVGMVAEAAAIEDLMLRGLQ
jgi:tetratricopeptide (TPR) repeat protein